MPTNEEAERLARAKRLREQIAKTVGAAGEPKRDEPPPVAESPREFVHRKMREQQERDGKKAVE